MRIVNVMLAGNDCVFMNLTNRIKKRSNWLINNRLDTEICDVIPLSDL
jgi:hypothetical protein